MKWAMTRINPFVVLMVALNLGAAAWYVREHLYAKAGYFTIGAVSLLLIEAM